MEELKIYHGDTILIRGSKRKRCPAIALKDQKLDVNKIRMNKCIRKNLRVKISDIVTVKS